MTEKQQHLQQILAQQKQVIAEINDLNSQITTKREVALKLQGVIEYLQQTDTPNTPDEK